MKNPQHYVLTYNWRVCAVFDKAKAMQFNGMKHIFIPRMALLSFVPAEPDLYREYRKWIEGERNEPVSCSLFVIGGKDNNEGYRGYRLVKPGTLGERIIGAE